MSQLQRGVLAMMVTVLSWAGLFPIGKRVLATLDPYYLTVIRYGIAAAILLVILMLREGPQVLAELRRDARRGWLVLYGIVGFAGFSLFMFEGLSSTSPAQAAVIAAMQPLIMALVFWVIRGVRPARVTLACVGLAFFGCVVVVSKGDLANLSHGGHVGGDLLVLVAAVCWVIYTLGAQRFADWSPLRYTALSCAFGTLGIFFIAAIATWLGRAHLPGPAQVASVGGELVFLILMTSVVAVLLWNVGVRCLGPLNATLFGNFIPVLVFAIGAAQGSPSAPAEYLGGAIVLTALVSNNLYARWKLRQAAA